jgi:ADP-heptose:LPS heptosyltransferase/glycosyltransferase involved in cell wall biosynthesis
MNQPKLIFRGPVLTASGYGTHARQLLKALLASQSYDISVIPTAWGATPFLMQDEPFLAQIRELSYKHELAAAQGQARYDISVQVSIPNEFEKIAPINIGVTAGIEVDRVSPEWLKKVNGNVDLLIVPSQHSADVFQKTSYADRKTGEVLKLEKPMVVCPEGVDTTFFNGLGTSLGMERFQFDAEFNFLYVGLGMDKPLGEDRKNLGNLIKWFCEEFKGDRKVGLVLKTALVGGSLMDFETTRMKIETIKKSIGVGEFPRIHLIHGRLSDEDLSLLYKHPRVKCFVTLTHGEGFGLPLIEAAACGVPVLATNWSGHLDFLRIDGKNRFVPIDYDLAEVPASSVWNGVIEQGSFWANPKEADFKNKLRKVFLSYDKPREWAAELSSYVTEKFDLRRVSFHFVNTIASFLNQSVQGTKDDLLTQVRSQLEAVEPTRKRLLYTMPMSGGDVFISSAVVNSLRKKYKDHAIFFATDPKYSAILQDNPDIDHIIGWAPWMQDVPLLEELFDEVYTPNLSIQTTTANWIRRGKGRLLGSEMAHLCDVEFGDYFIKTESVEGLPEKYIVLNPGSGKGQWEARNYLHWQEVVDNLSRLSGLPVVQVGTNDDPLYKGVCDFRGKTTYNQLAKVVEGAALVVGIDTITSHLAAAFEVPQVSLYGSSYSTSTGPVQKKNLAVLLDTPDRYGCDRACYKYQCSVDKDHPCINEIAPKEIVRWALDALDQKSPLPFALDSDLFMDRYEEHRPKISGYTHVLNPELHGFPYLESISSMLGFCDEVVVIDGGSTDGSQEKIRALSDKINLIERKWDYEEPGMDGMQKAFARAMCSGDFLWQQDADEVVHEDDYEKVRKLVKRFPSDCSLVHLPVVELWGKDGDIRTDRHSWKWRLSRNDFRITHGINKDARLINEKTGKTYSKRGMSDGCEMIDIMTGEYISHKGFYTQDLENLRRMNPTKYGEEMNKIFNRLPCVYHYSWANLKRKIENFRDFWDKTWSRLYNDDAPRPRFPDVVTEEDVLKKAKELQHQGGEHGKVPTFKLERTNPAVMKKWLSAIADVD